MSRIWEHFLYTLSLVTKSRSRYRKLTSPRPSCLCNYSISWLDSVHGTEQSPTLWNNLHPPNYLPPILSWDLAIKNTCNPVMTYFNFRRRAIEEWQQIQQWAFCGVLSFRINEFWKEERSWIINGPLCRWEKVSRFCWSYGLIFWHNNWKDVKAATWTVVSDIRSIGKWDSSSDLPALLMRHWLCHVI